MYCRHCGNEIEDDSRFCPYCGREVRTVAGTEEATVSTNVPNEQEAEQTPPPRKTKRKGVKKLVLAASIVLGLATLGVGISAFANNAKENKKTNNKTITATPTPTPTKAPTKAPTKTPAPTKVPTINDVAMLIYGAPVELGTEHKVVRIQLVENDYDGNLSLTFEIEDTSIVSCEWGEWAKDNTIPLRIYPEGIGETTITIKLADSNISKEIKVYSNGEYTFANFSKTMYAKSSVNVRSLPSTDGTKLGSLEEGEAVEVTGQCNETNWYRIVYNGKTAFVSSKYLLEMVEQTEPETTDALKPTETPKPTEKPKATATPKPSSNNQNESSQTGTYSITSQIDGSTISAKLGQCTTLYKHTKHAEGDGRATVQLPDIEAYSNGVFYRTSCTVNEDGEYEYIYKVKGSTSEKCREMMKNYHDLLEEYSITVTRETNYKSGLSYGDYLGGDYTGSVNITANSIKGYRETYDLTFLYYEYAGIMYVITCPEEFTFVDFGDRCDGTKEQNPETAKAYKYTSSLNVEAEDSGKLDFKINGWNSDTRGNYVMLVLNPEMCEEGDEFGLDYLINPSDDTCSFAVCVYNADGTADFWISYEEDKERFKEASVKILEKTDTVLAVSFYIRFVDRVGNNCVLEGIFAEQTGQANYAGGQGNSGNTGMTTSGMKCTNCDGYGNADSFCQPCMGNGEIDCRDCYKGEKNCTKCGGDGTVYDSLNGRETDCYICTRGKVRCSNCYGKGTVQCTQCGGDGEQDANCIICGGDGKL